MRVLVVPESPFFQARVLLQEVERKALRFLTPITWTKLECSRQSAHCMVRNYPFKI